MNMSRRIVLSIACAACVALVLSFIPVGQADVPAQPLVGAACCACCQCGPDCQCCECGPDCKCAGCDAKELCGKDKGGCGRK